MTTIVAGLMAMTALVAGLANGVAPIDSVFRASVAFVVGLVATAIWRALFDRSPIPAAATADVGPSLKVEPGGRAPDEREQGETAEAA